MLVCQFSIYKIIWLWWSNYNRFFFLPFTKEVVKITRKSTHRCLSLTWLWRGVRSDAQFQFSQIYFMKDYMMGLLQMPKIMSSNEADRLFMLKLNIFVTLNMMETNFATLHKGKYNCNQKLKSGRLFCLNTYRLQILVTLFDSDIDDWPQCDCEQHSPWPKITNIEFCRSVNIHLSS